MTDLLIVVDMQRDFVSGALWAASRPAPSFPLSPHAFSRPKRKIRRSSSPSIPMKKIT